jgi:hypothetical protein
MPRSQHLRRQFVIGYKKKKTNKNLYRLLTNFLTFTEPNVSQTNTLGRGLVQPVKKNGGINKTTHTFVLEKIKKKKRSEVINALFAFFFF